LKTNNQEHRKDSSTKQYNSTTTEYRLEAYRSKDRMTTTALKAALQHVFNSDAALRSVDSSKAVLDANICSDDAMTRGLKNCLTVLRRVVCERGVVEQLSALPLDTRSVVSGVVAVALYTSNHVFLP